PSHSKQNSSGTLTKDNLKMVFCGSRMLIRQHVERWIVSSHLVP
ncbi:14191_t:CDS:1, partial [Cetraspora pellucida]